MSERLSDKTLNTLSSAVAEPGYDRSSVTPGIVHLGVGAFHRAHQAAYVDECLAAGEMDWGIIGASLQSASTADALGPQDGLYTLAERGSDGEKLRVIGSIEKVLVAPQDPARLLDALTDPRIRIVSLTITEKAYLRNAAGDLDAAHPGIVADLANPARAADGARLSRGGAGAAQGGRGEAVHHPFLRQPSVERRDAAPTARAVRRAARCGPRQARRKRVLPVEHGRPHRAGDHRCGPRARLAKRSASRMPGLS